MSERDDELGEPELRQQQSGTAPSSPTTNPEPEAPVRRGAWVSLPRTDNPTFQATDSGLRLVAPTPPYQPPAVDGHGLGRLPALDPRDAKYSMARALATAGITEAAAAVPTHRMWLNGPVLDQGATPTCVAHAWAGFMAASPVRTKVPQVSPVPEFPSLPFTLGLYEAAKQVDEWPGENYDGTSVRAGAKVLQRLGRLSAYLWAFDAETVRTYVLARGPVVIGINWYDDMFDADPAGARPLNVSGPIVGGHALLVLGYSRERTAFRLLNSWGASWGHTGRAWLTFSDMQQLLRDEDGEACSATETTPIVAE